MSSNPSSQIVLLSVTCLILIFLSTQGNQVDAFYGHSRVTLFENTNREGDAFFLRVGSECVELPDGIRRWASSLETHGTCVLVCRYSYCRNCVRMFPGSPGQHDLSDVDFNDQISSVAACGDQDYLL